MGRMGPLVVREKRAHPAPLGPLERRETLVKTDPRVQTALQAPPASAARGGLWEFLESVGREACWGCPVPLVHLGKLGPQEHRALKDPEESLVYQGPRGPEESPDHWVSSEQRGHLAGTAL